MPRRGTLVRSLLGFVLPTVAVAAAVTWFFVELGPYSPGSEQKISLTIPYGSSVRSIGRQLEEAKLIRNQYAFDLAVVLAGLNKSLQAGTYELSQGQSATAIARTIGKGQAVTEVTLTIPEGWTSSQIGAYLEEQKIGTKDEFLALAALHDSRDIFPDQTYDFLAGRPLAASLEGYFFPDRYRVFLDATSKDVVGKMLNNFGTRVTNELRQEAIQQGHTLFEVVTLASIVDHEVSIEQKYDQDRAMVADIFWRRLKAGIPLQSDATVNYVTGKNLLQPTLSDLQTESLYNTYLHAGLPPGPIGNPGIESIKAVIRPMANQNFYFLTDKAKVFHYAETYEGHLANKQQYLQ